MKRSCDCGALRKADVGRKVTLSGWVHRRRDHGGLIFIDLRDRFGLTQLLFDPKISPESHKKAEKLRQEWVITVEGEVFFRGKGLENPNLPTGDIELSVSFLEVLSVAKTPPFSLSDETIDVKEDLRLKYRYLDIRRGEILKKLLLRHRTLLEIRNFLDRHRFVEIATPILSKTTPEGARDFLVPSRIHPGNFYALPQSPQIFKQLLMVGGVDRYFQIAPCFRDEDLRSDRQPEFHQIDIEMSFSDPEELFCLIEDLLKTLFKQCLDVDISTPFPRMSYKSCKEQYGTDKPDLRFGMLFQNLTSFFQNFPCPIFSEEVEKGAMVKGFCVEGGAKFSRKEVDSFLPFVGSFGISGISWVKFSEEGFSSNLKKFFDEKSFRELQKAAKAKTGDLLLFVVQKEDSVDQVLDHLRRHIAKKHNLIDTNSLKFLWVVEFPLFSSNKETGEIQSEHHPFTSPHNADLSLIDTTPLKMRAHAYDLVLNGYEIASGSQRIHDAELQEKIFHLLNLSEKEIHHRFGYFIEALRYGAPPHLGLALGVERLIMLLSKTENIREVVAFPKTQKGSDLMTQSPSPALPEQLKELVLQTKVSEIHWN